MPIPRLFLIVLLIFSSNHVMAEEKQLKVPELEKTYRAFIKAIHHKEFDKVLGFIHRTGIVAADSLIPKEEIAADLKNPDSYLREMLYMDDEDLRDTLCDESGVSPLSIFEFYEKFADKYQVEIVGFPSSKFFSVGGYANGKTSSGKKCRYYLFANIFLHDDDGKYYLGGGFE